MARVLFIQNFWFEYLGTMILSAILKRRGHTVDLAIHADSEAVLQAVQAFRPDVVAMYVVSGSQKWALDSLRRIKEATGVFTVMGGPHPTFYPDIVREDGVDAICIGEGDGALPELVDALDRSEPVDGIQNLWVKTKDGIRKNPVRELVTDLDSLPFPDRELYYKYNILRDSPSKHFITGRGCPFNCSFCCNKAYKEIYRNKGAMVRRPQPEKVCKEIAGVRRKYPLKAVRFDDEVFVLQPDWLEAFLDRYRVEVGLPYSCLVRADLMNERLVKILKASGCYIAYFGIESGNERIRNRILGKGVTREQIEETAYLLRKYKIKIGTFNMVGMPGETFENAWETVVLNQKIRSDYPWCSIIQPYPGTEFEKTAKAMGCLDPNYGVDQLQQSYFNDTVIANEDADKLVALQKLFFLAVKAPSLSGIIRRLAESGTSNFMLRWIFNLTYAYRYSRTYKISFPELLRRALLWKDNY